MKKLLLLSFFSFSSLIAIAQNFEWSKGIGGTGEVTSFSVVSDSIGNVYNLGRFTGTADFDPGLGDFSLTSSATYFDLFIQKLDANGNFVWVKKIDCINFSGGYQKSWFDIAIDSNNDLYISAHFETSADLDLSSGSQIYYSSGYYEAFIIKLDPNGNQLWTKTNYCLGSNEITLSHDIFIDKNDNILHCGNFSGLIDFDLGLDSVVLNSSNGHGFIEKLDPNGDLLWAKNFGSIPKSVVQDDSFNYYIAGSFLGAVDFDPGPDSNIVTSSESFYVLKLDSLGNFIWVKTFGTGTSFVLQYPDDQCLVVTDSGYVIFSGIFDHTIDCDPSSNIFNVTSNNAGSKSTVLVKLDLNGNFVNAFEIGGVTQTNPFQVSSRSIKQDKHGYLYLTGSFQGVVDFDPGVGSYNLNSFGGTDENLFILKMKQTGEIIWAHNIGGANFSLQAGECMHVDSDENIYVSGIYTGLVDFDPGIDTFYMTTTSYDFFTLKFNQDICSDFNVTIDEIRNVSCNDSGLVIVHPRNGTPPYSYLWSNVLSVNDSVNNNFLQHTIFVVELSDSSGCIDFASGIVDGPLTTSSFDLKANLVSTDFRNGLLSQIWLDAFNDGCVPTSGNLALILDSLIVFSSAIPTPDIINGDTLIWNFSNLAYDSIHIIPQITVQTPTWAIIGDTVCFKIKISPVAGDMDTTNNIKQYCFPIINGYDPNDKTVYPTGTCIPNYIDNDQLLTYTVRFQNTGNASAINIYVLDTLDPDLNLNTVRVIGNSHSLITEVLPGNVLKFRFDNINLADSTSNEAESHGYVIFEVLPNTGLSNGTAITNSVGIYFDYNPPVYTNTVLNTISDGTVNTNVSTAGNTLIADLPGVSYQWLDCDNGNSIIVGATNQSYTASTSGSYAVIINDGCFIDTSACTLLTVIGISEVENSNQFSFYPNPSNNTITITTNEPTQIKIINMLGEVVIEKQVQNNMVIDINNLSNGIYFIQTKEGYSTKLIKN
ncbi:MAG: T9SS type A sorting domain-containing protein [Bacteroidetes bacterium]|nr:T9SS type A sorting domain-containing protein [Bacteroidota bacterium]